MQELLAMPKVYAVGECGLDYSGNPELPEKILQQEIFHKQLSTVREKSMPVVLHFRDIESNDLACSDAIKIMTSVLPKQYPIHRHCFSGTKDEKDLWFQHFPNTKFGFTSTIPRRNQPSSLHQVISQLSWDQILLESDAPYLPPGVFFLPFAKKVQIWNKKDCGGNP